jgi:hypothetical protein
MRTSSLWLLTPIVVAVVLVYSNGQAAGQDATQWRLLPSDETPGSTERRLPLLEHCVESRQELNDQLTPSREVGRFDWRADHSIVVSRRHVRVVGGLLPTPNIAAQAGSIDPNIAAMAVTGGDQHRQRFPTRRVPSTEIRVPLRPCPSP